MEYFKVGPNSQSLSMRIFPQDGPTRIALGGPRAMARMLMAREAAGLQADHLTKTSHFKLDEAAHRPWPVTGERFLHHARMAGLTTEFDTRAAQGLSDDMARIQARYSRWLPPDEASGRSEWTFDPGTIRPEHKAEVDAGLKHLGWDDPQALFSFAYQDVCEIGTKRDTLLSTFTGAGKSRASLAVSEYWRYADRLRDPTLPFAPTIIIAQRKHLRAWEEELGGIASKAPCALLVATYGPRCYETWIDRRDAPSFTQPFLLVSFERLWRLTAEEMRTLTGVARHATVMADESYAIANKHAKRSGAISMISGAHHISVSATPIRSFVDSLLFPLQWTFRGGSVALPDFPLDRQGSEKRFASLFVSYAINQESGGRKKIPFIKNRDEFDAMLAPLMKRRLRGEPEVVAVLGAALLEEAFVPVDLAPAHEANYRAVLSTFTDWYTRELVKRGTPNAFPPNELLVKLGYLVRGVAQPWRMADHSDEEFDFAAFPKALTSVHERALEIAEKELADGNISIIFGNLTDPLDLIAEAARARGLSVGVIHGKVSHEARAQVISSFQRGEIELLIGSTGTLAEGYNLNVASVAIIIESDWQPSTTRQAVGRITRGIQELTPRAYYLSARGTIQDYMIEWCRLKSDSISSALDSTTPTVGVGDVPDITAFAYSFVGIGDPEEVAQRPFALDAS
jgi:Helicase conserved C-terminal domain